MDDLFGFMDSVGSWFGEVASSVANVAGDVFDAFSSTVTETFGGGEGGGGGGLTSATDLDALPDTPSVATQAALNDLGLKDAGMLVPESERVSGYDVPSQDAAQGMIAAMQAPQWNAGEALPTGSQPEWKGLPEPVQSAGGAGMLSNISGWVKENPKLAEFIARTIGGIGAGNAKTDQLALLDRQQQHRMEYANWARNNLNNSVQRRLTPGGAQTPLANIRGEEIHNGMLARAARGG